MRFIERWLTNRNIRRALDNAAVVDYDDSSKIIIISDLHRGTGDVNDDFAQNSNLCEFALKHYYNNGYTYIELGDGDELWENKYSQPIVQNHINIFWQLQEFYKANRLIMLYGNHDIVKRSRRWRGANFSVIHEEYTDKTHPLFPGLQVSEGLILRHKRTGKLLNLIHGHQASMLNSTFWRLGRFLVRYVWRTLENIGVKQPLGTAEQRLRKRKTENLLMWWCKRTGKTLIAGHTHRTYFPQQRNIETGEILDDVDYYNSGSCVHPRCITCIEIVGGNIALVKWSVEPDKRGALKIVRTKLAG